MTKENKKLKYRFNGVIAIVYDNNVVDDEDIEEDKLVWGFIEIITDNAEPSDEEIEEKIEKEIRKKVSKELVDWNVLTYILDLNDFDIIEIVE